MITVLIWFVGGAITAVVSTLNVKGFWEALDMEGLPEARFAPRLVGGIIVSMVWFTIPFWAWAFRKILG